MFLITGGGSGIGQALACMLAVRGIEVCIVGRTEKTLRQTQSTSSLINYICADVTTSVGRDVIKKHLDQYSSLQGIVHNAGIIEPITSLSNISETAWRQIMATNLDAPLFLTQLLLDRLEHGRVLTIGSGAAYFPVAGWGGYCVSKAAVSMLTRVWQLEYKSIAFASVMPGIIDTAMQAHIRTAPCMHAEKQQFFKDLQANDRLISPQTVALFLCWLLLDLDSIAFSAQEWDIYDTQHHHKWLISPYTVPTLDAVSTQEK